MSNECREYNINMTCLSFKNFKNQYANNIFKCTELKCKCKLNNDKMMKVANCI